MAKPVVCATAVLVCGLWAAVSPASAQTPTLPQFGHVIIVVEENAGYSSVVGNSSMPYLNSLISQYGLATNYTADTHPSIGNYMMLTTGHILTNDDGQTPSSFPVSADNIAHELELAGKTWKDYVEHSGTYYDRHDPLAYMTNINNANLVDFTQFSSDLANGTLPNLSWVVPNGCDDAHDCSPSTADSWLQTNIDPLINNAQFKTDGLLIVVFDEDENTGSTSCTDADIQSANWCGGQVAAVVVSPFLVSTGFKSSVSYHHESVLRLMAQGLGLTVFPGLSSTAGNLSDFFSSLSAGLTLLPATLAFTNQPVGTSSASQTLTLKNGTASSVSISGIAIAGTNSGDFAQTNGCGSSLAAGASCPINVTFKPTATGARIASVTVTDSGTGSPHSAALSGTGATNSASVSPTSLTFASTTVGQTSSAQSATLTNTGSTALTITSVGVSGDFSETNTCGSSVAAGGQCTISVTFKPTAAGSRTGTLTINESASGTPPTISLTGTGTAAAGAVSLSPTSLTFPSQAVGTSSTARIVTFSNTGGSALTITSISIAAPFAQTNNCGSSVAAGASCTINVTFTPTATGTATGTLAVADNATGSPQTASLTGTSTTSGVGGGALDYFVSPSGSDSSGDGSAARPWATIAYASTQIGPGATVHVAPGTYSGPEFNTNTSGTAAGHITYISDTKWGAKLVGTSGSTWSNYGSYVDIVNFDVTGPGYNGLYTEGDHTRYLGNNVHDVLTNRCDTNGGTGINLNGTNAELNGNYVHDNGPANCSYVHGIYFLVAGGSAYNNIVFNNAGWGIQLWHDPSHINIVNNTIFNNQTGGIVIGNDTSSADYCVVNNNIVYANGLGISEEGTTGTHNVYQNNLVYQNSSGDWSLQNGLTATGTVSANPLFANYTGDKTGDYHLQATSPAVDAGTSSSTPTTDYDGVTRPQGSAVDIGALEYVGARASTVTLAPASLTYTSQAVGATSTAQSLTLTNGTNSSLTISGIAITGANSGDFALTDGCAASLAAAGSCTINVTFKPTASGTRSATVTVTDNATNSPQTASLTGTVTGGAMVTLSPGSLAFAGQTVGASSAVQAVKLSNTGSAALNITSIAASGDFSETNDCGVSVTAGANCSINVTFNPSAAGARNGAVTVTDDAPGSPQTIALSGTGMDFEWGEPIGAASLVSVTAGDTANFTLHVTPQGGFNRSVSLSCNGAPSAATCSVTPSSVTSDGTHPATVTIRVTTTARSVSSPRAGWPAIPPGFGKLGIVLWFLFLLALMLPGKWAKNARRQCWLGLAATAFFVVLLTACGGGGSLATASQAGTPAGTYMLTVTATSGSLKHSTSLTLTVN